MLGAVLAEARILAEESEPSAVNSCAYRASLLKVLLAFFQVRILQEVLVRRSTHITDNGLVVWKAALNYRDELEGFQKQMTHVANHLLLLSTKLGLHAYGFRKGRESGH